MEEHSILIYRRNRYGALGYHGGLGANHNATNAGFAAVVDGIGPDCRLI
jgi:hypothetical protein